MRKQRPAVIVAISQAVVRTQQQLETIRQLLNAQMQFSLQGSFNAVLPRSSASLNSVLDLFSLKSFLFEENQREHSLYDAPLQNLIKFYSGNKLQLGKHDWSRLIFSRQDKLLAKLTQQRKPIGEQQPYYLSDYCRKLLLKQCQLHRIIMDNSRAKTAIIKWMDSLTDQQNLYEHKFRQFYLQFLAQDNKADPENSYSLLHRYIKRGAQEQTPITVEDLSCLFLPKNTRVVQRYLQAKKQQLRQTALRNNLKSSPYIHKQFKKLTHKQLQNLHLTLRQANSIDKHILRNKTLPTSQQINKKIRSYVSQLESHLVYFFKSLQQISNYTSKLDQLKEQILKQFPCNFRLLYQQVSANPTIVPSELKTYLQALQIEAPLSGIFLLFKRFADPITGKMSCSQFCSIFKSLKAVCNKSSKQVSSQFRKAFIDCLLAEISTEAKIEQLKRKLISKVDIRQIFQVLDQDSDGVISGTDLQVMHRKAIGQRMQKDDLSYFWWRMGSRYPSELVQYQRFLYEIIPKTHQHQHNSKS